MQIKQVWMSPDTRDRRPYGLRLLGGMLGIAGLIVLIILGGTAIFFYLGLPQKMGALALVLGATALGTVLALGLGRRAVQDATMFFLTGDDRLFAMDARALSDHGHDVLGYAKGAMETQKFLQCLAEQPYIPAGADEILLAKEVRTYRRCHVLRCLVRHPNRQVVPKTYILPKGYAQEKALLCQLEGRRDPDPGPEPDLAPQTFLLLLSSLSLVALIGLCVLSHPAVARLPQAIYFPCLALARFLRDGLLHNPAAPGGIGTPHGWERRKEMKRVKITVLKTTIDQDLAAEYGVAGLGPCPMLKPGQVFYADYAKPDKLCDEAWKAMYQYVFALAHGAERELFYYGDWIRTPGVAICSCNDGLRPVIFKLETTDLVSTPSGPAVEP